MIHEINKEVKEQFKTWTKFSATFGYKGNFAKPYILNNIKKLNSKLKSLGLELCVKKTFEAQKKELIKQGLIK